MSKRITLTDQEIKVVVQCLESHKDDGVDHIPKRIGAAFMQALIDKLLHGMSGDITL